jgi:hypothetical protein
MIMSKFRTKKKRASAKAQELHTDLGLYQDRRSERRESLATVKRLVEAGAKRKKIGL